LNNYKHRLLSWFRMNAIERLEEEIVTELRVLAIMFGNRPGIHADWARATIDRPEYADYYLKGWRIGRRMAWARLVRMAERLHQLTGEDNQTWAAHMHRLEVVGGTDVLALLPTTRRANLWSQ
jgi:hypothetical protein